MAIDTLLPVILTKDDVNRLVKKKYAKNIDAIFPNIENIIIAVLTPLNLIA
jgi:hypothetical protein